MLEIGKKCLIDWNVSKVLGDTAAAGHTGTVEAFGADWAVFRGSNGRAYAVDFPSQAERDRFLSTLSFGQYEVYWRAPSKEVGTKRFELLSDARVFACGLAIAGVKDITIWEGETEHDY